MSVIVCEKLEKSKFLMRQAYNEIMTKLARKDERLILVDADVAVSLDLLEYMQQFPLKFVDCGIQEANMVGVAAGLSTVGFVPFAHTFAPFVARRACDQIFISGAYAKRNVRIVGSDPGITAAYNGGTHMPFEDVSIMRAIPEMTIIEPTDTTVLKDIIVQSLDLYGMFYIRMSRKGGYKIYEEDSTVEIGKANLLREGTDVTIIAAGILVAEALKAYDILKEKGIYARILDMFTLKPADNEAIIKAAKETGAIVTAENHNIMGGLGSIVSEILAKNIPTPVEFVGINDEFGEVGSEEELRQRFKLTAEEIVNKVETVLARK